MCLLFVDSVVCVFWLLIVMYLLCVHSVVIVCVLWLFIVYVDCGICLVVVYCVF